MYVVYVNKPNNKALVHAEACGHYLARVSDNTVNGYWSGPYPTLDAGLAFAKSTGRSRVESAKGCCDRLKPSPGEPAVAPSSALTCTHERVEAPLARLKWGSGGGAPELE